MNDLARIFPNYAGEAYPKLVGGKLSSGQTAKFELANGRFLDVTEDSRAANYSLHNAAGEVVARCYWYLDEESDVRRAVQSFFSRAEFPEWHNEDRNPHVELDYEVSSFGSLQTVSLNRYVKSFESDSGLYWRDRPRGHDNDIFIGEEWDIIQKLNGFFNKAVETLTVGNKPDLQELHPIIRRPLFEGCGVVTSDVVAPNSYEKFKI